MAEQHERFIKVILFLLYVLSKLTATVGPFSLKGIGHVGHGHFGLGRLGPDISATDIAAITINCGLGCVHT